MSPTPVLPPLSAKVPLGLEYNPTLKRCNWTDDANEEERKGKGRVKEFRLDLFSVVNAPVKVNPDSPAPHPRTCGALVGLYHHIGSSLSPQYVRDSRVFLLLS